MVESVINSREEALGSINKCSIVTLFPIKCKTFPNLYRTTKGPRSRSMHARTLENCFACLLTTLQTLK